MTAVRCHLGQLIDGQIRPDGSVLEVRNPSRHAEVVGTVVEGTAADVDAAVGAATTAATTWAALPLEERMARLATVAEAIDARAEDIVQLVARENGSALRILRAEVKGAAAAFRFIGHDLASELTPRRIPTGVEGEFVTIARRPLGVVASIVPWNAPLILTANKIAPALVTGNTVVLKPSPLAPLGVTMIGHLVGDALPAGAINVVNGGAEVGGALTAHRGIRKVSFTGGGATARHIMRQAADTLKGIHFELGGNDPAILLDDADLELAAERITEAAFRRSGQVCFAPKRVYVPRARLAEFAELMTAAMDRIVVGDPSDERATMGPLNNEAQLANTERLRASALAEGREVRDLGSRLDPDGWAKGWFHQPTLVVDAEQDDALVREEQFGPILPLIAYDGGPDEVVALANDTDYGLCSSVWSTDPEKALDVAGRLEAGMTIINNHLFSPTGIREIPFGGWKQSGIGWEGSPYGIDEYLQFHSIDVQGSPERSSR